MDHEDGGPIRAAARAAYEAACRSGGGEPDDEGFSAEEARWLAVAAAARGVPSVLPDDASAYVRAVFANGGIAGLGREAERLLHKMRTAASLYRDGRVKAILTPIADVEARVERALAAGDLTSLAVDLDLMQSRILEAQRLADPCGRASLVLHTDEAKWDRYDSYAAYLRSFEPKGREGATCD